MESVLQQPWVKKGNSLGLTSNVVALVQVQAEELGKQAWEEEEIHLQQILKAFFLYCFIALSLEQSFPT